MSGVLVMESTVMTQPERLPRLIEQAAAALAKATTAAEILEAREAAALVYDAAKAMARLAKAKQAHDEVIAACLKMQADALLIEARAQCRLADEYDAAQARGEVAKHSSGNPQIVPKRNDLPPTAADLGFTRKVIMTARKIRDAEKARPGIVEKTLAAADEPTRARLMRAVEGALTPPKPVTPRPKKPAHAEPTVTPYDLLSGYTEAITRPELNARIAELEQERDHYKQMAEHCDAGLRQAGAHLSRARDAFEKLDPILEAKDREIAQLKARIAELESGAPPLGNEQASSARAQELEAELVRAQNERDEFGRRYWEIREYVELRTEGIFTHKEFNKLRSWSHPDRAQGEAEKKRHQEAYDLIGRCEKLLKKEPLPQPPELPTTRGGWAEARLQVKRKNRERALKAAATRGRKKPGRQLHDGRST
jgi:hypothetical protein